MMDPGVTFAPGRRIGNYEMLVELASGGTATVGIAVYRGAEGFERLVVVKRVHRHLTKDGEFMAMLLDEAKLASSVRHANVVPVIDVVRAQDEVVLVMDYVEGVSLAELARQATENGKRLPIGVASRIVHDVLVGLHEAHEAVDLRRQPLGIVHRDVSPQNVLVGVDGTSRIIDFGIAKATSRSSHTRAGVIKGKCAYMAPEQVDGLPVDRRCDVFAAGVVLWETLTGQRLFKGQDEFDEMRRVMRAPIPPPSGLAPDCGPDVDAVLAHALARPLEERFQTARAFARALEQAIPPAPARVVGEHVEAICGAELAYRLSRLQAILGDELDKISPRATGRASGKTPVAGRAPVEATVRLEQPQTPASAGAPQPGPMTTLRSGSGEPSSRPPASGAEMGPTEMPVEADVPVVPKRSAAPVVIGVTVVSLLLGAGVGALVLARRESTPASAVSASASAPAPAPAPASASAPASAPAPASASAPASAPASASVAVPSPARVVRPVAPPRRELKSNPYEH